MTATISITMLINMCVS